MVVDPSDNSSATSLAALAPIDGDGSEIVGVTLAVTFGERGLRAADEATEPAASAFGCPLAQLVGAGLHQPLARAAASVMPAFLAAERRGRHGLR